MQASFRLLTTLPIPRGPLDELLAGFETDLSFSSTPPVYPISTEADLEAYAQKVASSVAELCVRLAWVDEANGGPVDAQDRTKIIQAARDMGVALQMINIARDVPADLKLGRIYLPGLSLVADGSDLSKGRYRLLDQASAIAKKSLPVTRQLPPDARGGMRAACQVYLEIGAAVRNALDAGDRSSRATVKGAKRIAVAWRALAN